MSRTPARHLLSALVTLWTFSNCTPDGNGTMDGSASETDGGNVDAGTPADSGTRADGGNASDASTLDAALPMDGGPTVDAGARDAGASDAGARDAGARDGGGTNTEMDAQVSDGGRGDGDSDAQVDADSGTSDGGAIAAGDRAPAWTWDQCATWMRNPPVTQYFRADEKDGAVWMTSGNLAVSLNDGQWQTEIEPDDLILSNDAFGELRHQTISQVIFALGNRTFALTSGLSSLGTGNVLWEITANGWTKLVASAGPVVGTPDALFVADETKSLLRYDGATLTPVLDKAASAIFSLYWDGTGLFIGQENGELRYYTSGEPEVIPTTFFETISHIVGAPGGGTLLYTGSLYQLDAQRKNIAQIDIPEDTPGLKPALLGWLSSGTQLFVVFSVEFNETHYLYERTASDWIKHGTVPWASAAAPQLLTMLDGGRVLLSNYPGPMLTWSQANDFTEFEIADHAPDSRLARLAPDDSVYMAPSAGGLVKLAADDAVMRELPGSESIIIDGLVHDGTDLFVARVIGNQTKLSRYDAVSEAYVEDFSADGTQPLLQTGSGLTWAALLQNDGTTRAIYRRDGASWTQLPPLTSCAAPTLAVASSTLTARCGTAVYVLGESTWTSAPLGSDVTSLVQLGPVAAPSLLAYVSPTQAFAFDGSSWTKKVLAGSYTIIGGTSALYIGQDTTAKQLGTSPDGTNWQAWFRYDRSEDVGLGALPTASPFLISPRLFFAAYLRKDGNQLLADGNVAVRCHLPQ